MTAPCTPTEDLADAKLTTPLAVALLIKTVTDNVTQQATAHCIIPLADATALANALDIQLDLQADAISKENAIREGVGYPPCLLYPINKFMENR